VDLRLNLSAAIYYFGNRKYVLKDPDDSISYAIAGLGLGICRAAETVVAIAVKLLAALAHIVCDVLDDAGAELSLEADYKVFILHAVLFLKSGHGHEGHICSFV
jgi:hypothetical protein